MVHRCVAVAGSRVPRNRAAGRSNRNSESSIAAAVHTTGRSKNAAHTACDTSHGEHNSGKRNCGDGCCGETNGRIGSYPELPLEQW